MICDWKTSCDVISTLAIAGIWLEIMDWNWVVFMVGPLSAALWNSVTNVLRANSSSEYWNRSKTAAVSNTVINHQESIISERLTKALDQQFLINRSFFLNKKAKITSEPESHCFIFLETLFPNVKISESCWSLILIIVKNVRISRQHLEICSWEKIEWRRIPMINVCLTISNTFTLYWM